MTTSDVTPDILLRIGMAFLAGVMLGFEREARGRAAGLRTTTLACVASCLVMILAQLFLHDPMFRNPAWMPDPGRVVAGILTGIGFLGAGVIIREGTDVRGVTTAAMLWYVTILGLVFGSGYIALGLVGLASAFICLSVLPQLEQYMHRDSYVTVAVTIQLGGVTDAEIRESIKSARLKVERVSLDYDLQQRQRKFMYTLKCHRDDPLDMAPRLVEKLTDLPGVTRVEWQ